MRTRAAPQGWLLDNMNAQIEVEDALARTRCEHGYKNFASDYIADNKDS